MSGTVPIVDGFYNYSCQLPNGFQATLTYFDPPGTEVNLTGYSVVMNVYDPNSTTPTVPTFVYSTSNNLIIINTEGNIYINVPGNSTELTPATWITAVQEYPYYTYNYSLFIYNTTGGLVIQLNGTLTIYGMNPPV